VAPPVGPLADGSGLPTAQRGHAAAIETKEKPARDWRAENPKTDGGLGEEGGSEV
jgi:hypothetical protein